MTAKSVIDIDINDAKFKEFVVLFDKYRAALKDMPADWGAISDEMKGASSLFEGIVAGMLTQSQLSTNVTKQEKDQERATRNSSIYWKDMARSTRDVAGNIVNATTSLLKWIGLTSVFTGLLGAGGLYGIDRMAAGVAAGRRSSTGLGTSYGGQKAFDISYGQTIDTRSFLSAVNESLHDVTKRQMFINAGMSGSEMQGDTATVGVRLLEHLQRIAKNTDPRVLGTKIDMLNLPLSLAEMLNLGRADLGQLGGRFSKEQSKLDLERETQDAWAQFTQQMQEAGDRLENVFVKALVRLEPQLENLSDSFIKLVEDIGDSDTLKSFIDAAKTGLEKFATFIGSAEFEQNVTGFINGIGRLGQALSKFANSWLGKKLGLSDDDSKNDWISLNGSPKAVTRQSEIDRLSKPNPVSINPNGSPLSTAQKFAAIERERGLPAGMLNSIYQAESGGGRYLRSAKGALGPFQFMPGTASQYGVTDPMNLDQSAAGAGRYLQHLMKVFNGNSEQAIAAYNWGEGNVRSHVNTSKWFDSDWHSGLPKETRDYVNKVEGGISQADLRALASAVKGSTTRVEIMNNSGGNVITQVSQVAQ